MVAGTFKGVIDALAGRKLPRAAPWQGGAVAMRYFIISNHSIFEALRPRLPGPGEGADPLLPVVIAAWLRRWGKPAQEVRRKAPK